MSHCPDIDRLLEDPGAAGAHLDACEACRGVSALLDLRHERIAGADDACERAELSIALLHESLLSELERVALTQHLETCSACNETAARVLALPAYDAKRPVALREPRYWRPLAVALGVSTLLASAAALALFFGRPQVDPVAVAPERVPLVEPRVGAPAPLPQPVPTLPLAPKQDPLPAVSPAVPRAPLDPLDPFVGGQTTPPPVDSKDEVMNPWGDTGFLSVVCNPICDSISVHGKKLGPSPVVRVVVPVGSQTVTGRRGRKVRSVVTTIEKGKTSVVRLQMPMDLGF